MYLTEYIPPVFLLILFVFSFLFNRRVVWVLCAFFSVTQVMILALRPDDYNSDTFNYSKYLVYISDAKGLDVFLVSKFEPFHLVLAIIANNFTIWLILEAIFCSFFLIQILRRLHSLESMAVVLGSALPLFSSSMRFSIGLLAVAYTMLMIPRLRGRSIVISIIGFVTHISLAAFIFIQRSKIWLILVLMTGLVLYAGSDIAFVERAGGGEDVSAGGSGLRAFLTLFLFLVFLYIRRVGYDGKSLINDVVISLALLFSANFIYPVFNRFIVLFLVIKAIDYDSTEVLSSNWSRFLRSLRASLLYIILVIPHVISINHKIMINDW